jgi:hypothetical protein
VYKLKGLRDACSKLDACGEPMARAYGLARAAGDGVSDDRKLLMAAGQGHCKPPPSLSQPPLVPLTAALPHAVAGQMRHTEWLSASDQSHSGCQRRAAKPAALALAHACSGVRRWGRASAWWHAAAEQGGGGGGSARVAW